ncbi:MAG: hypothetical protein ACI8XB_001669, partial [Patiriisocius sp.]
RIILTGQLETAMVLISFLSSDKIAWKTISSS